MEAKIVKVNCPHCQKQYSIKESVLGKTTTCKKCKKKFELKLEEEEPQPIEEEPVEESLGSGAEHEQEEGSEETLHCESCEIKTTHINKVCSVCDAKHGKTDLKSLIKKTVKLPYLGDTKIVYLVLAGVLPILLYIGTTIFFKEEPKKVPKRVVRKRPVQSAAEKAKAAQLKNQKVNKPEVSTFPEYLPEISLLSSQNKQKKETLFKALNSKLIVVLGAIDTIDIIKNEETQLVYLKSDCLGKFSKFNLSFFEIDASANLAFDFSPVSESSGNISSGNQIEKQIRHPFLIKSLDEVSEEEVTFFDFTSSHVGKVMKEEGKWVFRNNTNSRMKANGLLMSKENLIIGFGSSIMKNSVQVHSLDERNLSMTGQWQGPSNLDVFFKPQSN